MTHMRVAAKYQDGQQRIVERAPAPHLAALQQRAGACVRSGSTHGTVRQLHSHGSTAGYSSAIAKAAVQVVAPAVESACEGR